MEGHPVTTSAQIDSRFSGSDMQSAGRLSPLDLQQGDIDHSSDPVEKEAIEHSQPQSRSQAQLSRVIWPLSAQHCLQEGGEEQASSYAGCDHDSEAEDEYDGYGFLRQTTNSTDGWMSSAMKDSASEAKIFKKWDEIMRAVDESGDLNRSNKLKKLIRSGIPEAFRGRLWRLLLQSDQLRSKHPSGLYVDLLKDPALKAEDGVIEEIERDIGRTFPGHRLFQSGEGTSALRRVLVAFAAFDSNVGYCQSLNFIAATLLLCMNEEEAFWCLASIVTSFMPPGYYAKDLSGSVADQQALQQIIEKSLPKVHAHLNILGAQLPVIITDWYLCMFTTSFPTSLALRVLDVVFSEGSQILHRLTIALISLHEKDILAQSEAHSVFELVRGSPATVDPSLLFGRMFSLTSLSAKSVWKCRKAAGLYVPMRGHACELTVADEVVERRSVVTAHSVTRRASFQRFRSPSWFGEVVSLDDGILTGGKLQITEHWYERGRSGRRSDDATDLLNGETGAASATGSAGAAQDSPQNVTSSGSVYGMGSSDPVAVLLDEFQFVEDWFGAESSKGT